MTNKNKKRPELDRNIVAYYKKNKTDETKNQISKTSTPNEETQEKKVKCGLDRLGSDVASSKHRDNIQVKKTRISPRFDGDSEGYDKIVVTPTHFNNKPFKGFISDNDAEIICKAIELHDTGNHHGTTFFRNDEDFLFITFKLKRTMIQNEVETKINKYFWYDKESKIGNLDRISGTVVHPQLESINHGDEQSPSNLTYGAKSGHLDDTKELRIDGCNYKLCEKNPNLAIIIRYC